MKTPEEKAIHKGLKVSISLKGTMYFQESDGLLIPISKEEYEAIAMDNLVKYHLKSIRKKIRDVKAQSPTRFDQLCKWIDQLKKK